MAQYDVHRTSDDLNYVVDCQSNLLNALSTRFVIPFMFEGQMVVGSARLNPTFEIAGRPMILVPQGAMTLRLRDLGPIVTSLDDDYHTIAAAMDFLLRGY